MTRLTRAYIGLGANLGDAEHAVLDAMAELNHLPHTEVVSTSSLYRSAPIGYTDQPDFINAVAGIDTGLSAHALLSALLGLEQDWGRTRSHRNAPRTLDLDLLIYGDALIDEPGLHVPHPRMSERAFVLVPLCEIAPGIVWTDGRPITELLSAVSDQQLTRLRN